MDRIDQMIAWENGDLDEADTVDLFQHLVNTGQAWQLQGCYGRFAENLLLNGLIMTPEQSQDEGQHVCEPSETDRPMVQAVR